LLLLLVLLLLLHCHLPHAGANCLWRVGVRAGVGSGLIPTPTPLLVFGGTLIQPLQQPGSNVAPFPVQGTRRHAQDLSRLVRRQAAEVAEQHDLSLGRVALFQLLQGLVDGENVLSGWLEDGTCVIQLFAASPAASDWAGLAPRLLNEDIAHGTGGGEEEVLP